MNPRDIAIRTIIGEAMGEGPKGWAAVAHVLRNRAADPRWPSSVDEVALQPKQFSAWNKDAGGNHLVNKYGPGTDPYEKVGAVYDQVMSGSMADPTGGATHYYSPAGMEALVSQGAQSNILPRWLQEENARRPNGPTEIGNHIFTGSMSGQPMTYGNLGPAPTEIDREPFTFGDTVKPEEGGIWDWINAESTQDMAQGMTEQQAPPPQWLQAPMVEPYEPVRRDPLAAYRSLFDMMRQA